MTDNARQAEALHSAVAAIYFADSSDYLPALWSVVQHLAPEMVAGLRTSPKLAFDQSMARVETASLAAQSADASNPVELIGAEFQKCRASEAHPRDVDTLLEALNCTLHEHGFKVTELEDDGADATSEPVPATIDQDGCAVDLRFEDQADADQFVAAFQSRGQ